MKAFFKYVFATIVGIIITTFLLVLIFAGIIKAAMSQQEKEVKMENNTILVLKLDHPIVDRKPNVPFDLSYFSKNSKLGLNEILNNISKAKEDENIVGIHLDLTFIPAGIATINEIRKALLDFKTTGKFVTVYSETFTQGAYLVATAADKIYFNPTGFFNFVGMRAQSPFFKNTLKKLDIEVTVIKYGAFKSAAEQLTEEKYSDANRQQLSVLIHSIWGNVCKDISAQRNISIEKLNEVADKLLIHDAQSAYDLGFVDSIVYRDQLLSILKEKTAVEEKDDLKTVSLDDYNSVPKSRNYKGLAKDKIAVVYASGEIISGEGGDDNIGAESFCKALRKARRDSTIKAVVLRVNSPGGSAMASEDIWRELSLIRQIKPLIVSMGDVAASGGYYISCGADSILVQANTITGSIGVISLFLNTNGMFNKMGITFDTEKTNEHSDFPSAIRPLHPAEVEYWQNTTNQIYKLFATRVAEGRHLTFDQVDKIGQGRIWTGTDAIGIGLADKIGGLDDAILMAKNMAGLDEKYRLIELPEREDPLEKIIKELTQSTQLNSIAKELGIESKYVTNLQNLLLNQGVVARLPFDITIY